MLASKALLTTAICLLASPAFAGPMGISEIRGGAMIDDVELYSTAPIWAVPRLETIHLENLDTMSFDVLFDSPDLSSVVAKPDIGWFNWLLDPRPLVGVDVNFKHESMAHVALNWHVPVGDTGIFIEPELGAAIHNGALSGAVAPMRNLGCRALFYWGVNIGYQINDNWSIMATEHHGSQDGLCGWTLNQGLNYEGIRVGFKF